MTGDDRFTPEQAEIDRKAQEQEPPPPRTEPCRRYVDNPVTPEEIMREAQKYAPKRKARR